MRMIMSTKGLLLWCLLTGTLFAQAGLGESLLLEGRMAMARAEQFLSPSQQLDGSWEGSALITAQAAMALANAGVEKGVLQHANAFLQARYPTASPEERVSICRYQLRLRQHLPPVIRTELRRYTPAELSLDACQWLLEIHYLLSRQSEPLLSTEVVSVLLEHLHTHIDTPAALRLFAALCSTTSDLHSPTLAAWRQEALLTADKNNFRSLLWLARAAKAYAALFPAEDGAWRVSIVIRLLESQQSDGSWGSANSPFLDTALALQALQHCLAARE